MAIQVSEYIEVGKRAIELGCEVSTGIAVLPANFTTASSKRDLIHYDMAATLRTLWRQAGVDETPLEGAGERLPRLMQESSDLLLPTIFCSALLLSQNPSAISVALSVISSYVTDWLKGLSGDKIVKLGIVVEHKTGACTLVDYEGPPGGLQELPEILREVQPSDAKSYEG